MNTFMSPLTFAMSTATRNTAQTFSYFIPGQPFLETFMPLSHSNQDHTFMSDYALSVFKQQTRLLLRLQRSVSCSDNQPLQFGLSILETFIPHSKIYSPIDFGVGNKDQMPAQTFYTCFPPAMTTSTKGFLPTQASLNF